ncbi:MAG: hypothetical protein PF570_06970 [Candidatus Cloacimonetes bacterium]|nr:hypothetical protein [Candidatus Cloacimonadota bacterium]
MIALPLFLVSEIEKNDLYWDRLKGSVKSVKVIVFDFANTDEGSAKQKDYSSLCIYDEFGYKTEFNEYFFDDNLENRTIYKYNDDNEILEEIKYNFDDNIVSRTSYKYDDRGNEIEEIQYEGNDVVIYKISHLFDANDNKVKMEFYDAKFNLLDTSFNEYNDNGKLIKTNLVISNAVYSSFVFYKYYGEGKLI